MSSDFANSWQKHTTGNKKQARALPTTSHVICSYCTL